MQNATNTHRHLGTHPMTTAQLFDPSTQWSSTDPMQQARLGHTATLLQDGHVLVAGGQSNTENVTIAELFDPSAVVAPTPTPTTTPLPRTPTPVTCGIRGKPPCP